MRIIELIANHYGYDAQSRQLIEEMAELTQAINKFWRSSLDCGRIKLEDARLGEAWSDIVEEIADVEIMLEQIKELLVCHREVDGQIRRKLDRQLKRIGKG